MIGINWQRKAARRLLTVFAVAAFILGLAGCGSGNPEFSKFSNKSASAPTQAKRMSEVSPPEAIQKLRQTLEIYQPQVSILAPKPDEVIQDTDISVRLQVKDLPIFKDAHLGLGPHLQVFLDNQPYQAVYDTSEPLVIAGLEPGSHTLRVFASRPWEESFKNDGAYAQTTFHIFTKTQDNNPDRTLPLLTYNRPQDTYGAQPIMLDFYLTNAPLHLAAQANAQDEILDWKIRATVNGESFSIDQWQPIYLKGFKPGKNWVQLEFIDERGSLVKNAFNNTVRLIDYQPQGQDTLSRLVRGELTTAESRGIVDRTYQPPKPEPKPIPAVETPIVKPSPPVPEIPVAKPSQDKIVDPEVEPVKETEPKATAIPELEKPKVVEPVKVIEPQPTATPKLETPKVVEPVKAIESIPTATTEPETPKVVESVKAIEPQPTAIPKLENPKVVEPTQTIESKPTAILQTVKQKTSELVNRFRSYVNQVRESTTSSPNLQQPTPPETTAKPTTELTVPETTISEPENQPKSEQKVEFAT
ncbi:MAG: hypothetical protein HC789_07725 [Microcoleus sp. CSU_2_2]|nr:hypothetical protein [Microcoleus sp. SU_5_3]NJS10271.1 hypothetical protein [Microcoleus sp. CSU_2_2]